MTSGNERQAGVLSPMYMPGAMDHQVNPRNAGAVADPDGIGRAGDPRKGDSVEVALLLDGDAHSCDGSCSAAEDGVCRKEEGDSIGA